MTVSKTTPKDHLIVLHEFLEGNKAHTMSSSIRMQVNCSQVSAKLHMSCSVYAMFITCDLTVTYSACSALSGQEKTSETVKFSIMKNGIGIKCQKAH